MIDKDIKKLSRQELLELLLEQTQRKEELEKELDETKRLLEEKEILLESAGSIATAALEINKVFEAADSAARQYVKSVKIMVDKAAKEKIERINSENIKEKNKDKNAN